MRVTQEMLERLPDDQLQLALAKTIRELVRRHGPIETVGVLSVQATSLAHIVMMDAEAVPDDR